MGKLEKLSVKRVFNALDISKKNQVGTLELQTAIDFHSNITLTQEQTTQLLNMFDQNGNGILDYGDIKKMAKDWGKLSTNKKSEFTQLAEDDKVRYAREVEAYEATLFKANVGGSA